MDFRTKLDQQTFGVRATALLVSEHQVFLGRRGAIYFTIGGAVKVNETSEEAVVREVKEELGIAVKVKNLAFVVENWFTQEGRHFHNIEFHYLVTPPEEMPRFMLENDHKYHCEWVSVENLENLDVRPSFLKTELKNWKGQVQHIVNRDGGLS